MANNQASADHSRTTFQTIRVDTRPRGEPIIPPVSNLLDRNGALIALDSDVLLYSWRKEVYKRGRVIVIGDAGLPGREVVGIRPHGSTYREVFGPKDIELHTFDDYRWLLAEEAAAHHLGDDRFDAWGTLQKRGLDLGLCMFGGFYFERFQEAVVRHYMTGKCERPY